MTTKTTDTFNGRPTAQTPYGLRFSDTNAYANYLELLGIRDWLTAFLSDTENLRINAAEAVQRIDDFTATLAPKHASLDTDTLARIRACLSSQNGIPLGGLLTGLRSQTNLHWNYAVSGAAQDCECVPTGSEIAYTGPFPRKSDHTPAYGYHRALAAGRY